MTEVASLPDWHQESCVMGIDEAGRGPVLGPMVYSVAYCPISKQDYLKKMGFADSKTLSEEKRDALFARLNADSNIAYEFDALSAALISGKMLARQTVSLNAVAVESTFKLIDKVITSGVNIQEVFVDALGNTETYKARLSQRFPGIKFVVESKADANYPIVSAASIVAKVTRDRQLKEYAPVEDVTISPAYGTGYPGDAVTKQWLEGHIDKVFGFPSLVRFSWSTCDPLLEKHAVPVKWECDEDGDASQQTLNFGGARGGPAAQASTGAGRHSYFRARKLQRIANHAQHAF